MAAGSVYIGVLVGPREGPRLRFRGRGLYNICEKLKPLSANCMIHFRLLAINFGPASAISAVQPLSAAFTFLSNAFEIPAQAVITPMAVITRRMINYRLIPKPDLWSAVRRRRGAIPSISIHNNTTGDDAGLGQRLRCQLRQLEQPAP